MPVSQAEYETVLPRQFPDADTFKSLADASEAATLVSQTAMIANIVLTVFLSVSLKAMWNMVHVLQVIVFLPTLIEFPPNAQLFIDSVNEAIELEQVTDSLYGLLLPDEVEELIEKKKKGEF